VTPAALFGWPAAFPLLLAAPAAWIAWRILDRSRARRVARLAGARAPVLARELAPERRAARRGLLATGAFFGALAIMQPLGRPDQSMLEPRGADVVVCLDLSRSMLARDAIPSRLEAAKRSIRELAQAVRGDRLALVLFAGQARLASPLTRDGAALAEIVSLADPTSVARGGSDLGAALEVALDALEGSTGDHQAIVVITDGEDLAGQALGAAERCRVRGVPVHAAGFGAPQGSKIAIPADGGSESFLRDRAGHEVVSALDVEGLRQLTAATGGDLVLETDERKPLVALYDRRILPKARELLAARGGATRENLFQWPLLAAVLLWLAELAWSDRRRA
jgi:Ca-activated chloride channel family protein